MKLLVIIVIIITAMSTSNAFYRLMPKLLENTLNRILARQLEMRFGRIPFLSYATNPASAKDQSRTLLEARGQKAWINRNENEGWLPCHLVPCNRSLPKNPSKILFH